MKKKKVDMSLFIVDVESDGPCPGLYSMISFGAVMVSKDRNWKTFHGKVAPLPNANRIEEAANVSGVSREEHETYISPPIVMQEFAKWIQSVNMGGKPTFVSDNPAFDWQFVNYYFHLSGIENPFGFSARRIGDIYAGAVKDLKASSNWKKLRKTVHDHNPVNDAIGNAEALLEFCKALDIKL
jgi:DNA polymerase III epsilon subunit-like protein